MKNMAFDKNELFELSILIYKHLTGNITTEEQIELDKWRNASERNKNLYEQVCSEKMMRDKLLIYKNCDVQLAFDSFVRRRERNELRRRLVVKISRYAAIIALPLFIALFYFNGVEMEEVLPEQTENIITIRKNVPVLTLSNGQQMVLYNQDLTLNEENGVQITMNTEKGMQYNTSDSIKAEMV